MALVNFTMPRIVTLILCAFITTFLLVSLEASSLSLDSFYIPSIRPQQPNIELVPVLEPPLRRPLITNNNATYTRLALDQPRSEYVIRAKLHLARLEALRHSLFDGSAINKSQMDRLFSYLRRAETEITYVPPRVVLTSWHWVPCAYGSCTTGEAQWIRPLIEIMKQHDIIYLFSPWENFRNDFKNLGNDLVTHVWADDEHIVWCFEDTARCIQNASNPDGVPPWKLFAFTFWGSKPGAHKWNGPLTPWSFNPLGSEWNLVPYHMPDKQYFLGYYYQGCEGLKFIPFDEREDRILVLAKQSNYYHMYPAFDPKIFYKRLQNHTRFEIVSNADQEEGFPIPEGLHSKGVLPKEEYDHLLANTKALLGIGKPLISPTPYASLCRGVPVILPYNSHLVLPHSKKTCGPRPGPSEWCGFMEETHQHGPASAIGPPYVYAVDVQAPIEEVLMIIDTAIRTPILPYVPPEMRPEAVEERLLDYFAIDWERYALQRMQEQGLTQNTLVLPDFLREWTRRTPDTSIKS